MQVPVFLETLRNWRKIQKMIDEIKNNDILLLEVKDIYEYECLKFYRK